jgi:peptidoglycan/LPS O-acetylase OafA/YrhL
MITKKFNFTTIDILRGFAATAVFFYHYGVSSMLNKLFKIEFTEIFAMIGAWYAVPLFFLISGFCIHLSQLKQNSILGTQNLKLLPYIKNRFWRIYPTYFILLLFSCSISAIGGGKISKTDFFIHISLCQCFSAKYFNSINLVLWTISVEFLFYLLYPTWYFLRTKFGLNQALFISASVSVISCLITTYFFNYDILTNKYFILNIWGGWCFGAWLCEKLVNDEAKFLKDKIWWSTGFLILITFYFSKVYQWAGLIRYNLIILLWGWLLVPFISLEDKIEINKNKVIKLVIKILVAIGVSSYSLYMLHEPLMSLRNLILLSVVSNKLRLIIGVIWFFATFFIAWVSFQLFEKPFISFRSKKA